MNKTNLAIFFCVTGFLKLRAQLSKDLSSLTILHPGHFALVSFQSHLFLLSFLLSVDDPLSTFAALSEPFLSNSINSLPRARNKTAHHYYVIQHLYLNSVENHSSGLGKWNQNKTYKSGVYSFKTSFLSFLSTYTAWNKYSLPDAIPHFTIFQLQT